MNRAFITCVTSLWLAAPIGNAHAAGSDHAREFLGPAAFGLNQVDVLLAALAALMVLFVVSTVSRRYWLAEVAFLLVVAAGLISNAIGMIVLTMASLFSVILLGLILDKLGFSATLTPADEQRIAEQIAATVRDDLGADPEALRVTAGRPERKQP